MTLLLLALCAQVEPDALIIIEEDPAPATPAAPSSESISTQVRTDVSTLVLADRRWELADEDVLEWWQRGRLTLKAQRGFWKASTEARVLWGQTLRASEATALGLRQGSFAGEVDLREAALHLSHGLWFVDVGQKILLWGKNELFSPADVINPIDARFGAMSFLSSPKDLRRPVFLARAGWASADTEWELVFLPFFAAHRFSLIGRDFSLAPPGSLQREQLAFLDNVHPSLLDTLSGQLATALPEESLADASFATRLVQNVWGWSVGLTASYRWDPAPSVRADADLLTLLRAQERLLSEPQLLLSDLVLRDAARAVQEKAVLGVGLVSAEHRRQWLLAADVEGTIGDLVLKADVGFRSTTTLMSYTLETVESPEAQGVFGIDYRYGEDLFVSVAGFGSAALLAPAVALVSYDVRGALVSERTAAYRYGVSAQTRYQWLDGNVSAQAAGILGLQPRDYAAQLSVQYAGWTPHKLSVGAVAVGGRAGTVGHSFTGNDLVFFRYDSAW